MSTVPPGSNSRSPEDQKIHLLKEYFTAGLAAMFIIGVFGLTIVSLRFIANTEDPFSSFKDLLLIYMPFLGVIIGYYFNKVTSDARAETAETAARTATVSAQQAVEVREMALAEASSATAEAAEMRTTLEDVTQAAADMVQQTEALPAGAVPGTLSFGDLEGGTDAQAAEHALKTRLELQAALARANKVLTR